MDKPIFKLMILLMAIGVWVVSLQSVRAGKWLGKSWEIRRDNYPIWFWCGVGLQNLISSYLIIEFLRELYAWLRGSP